MLSKKQLFHFIEAKDFRPQLPREPEDIRLGIVCDPVEDVVSPGLILSHQATEFNPTEHLTVGRSDPADSVGHPDVGPDFAAYPL